MSPFIDIIIDTQKKLQPVKKIKTICFCLSRHVYDIDNVELYNEFIKKISHFISYLVCNQKYKIILLPFNTGIHNNDILIQNDVIELLSGIIKEHITNITTTQSVDEIINIFNKCKLIIPMNIHSTLFSIYLNIPFLPLITTRNLINLMKDIEWKYKYILPVNNKFIPTDININILTDLYTNLINNYLIIKEEFFIENNKNVQDYLKNNSILLENLDNDIKLIVIPITINKQVDLIDLKIKLIIHKLIEHYPNYPNVTSLKDKKICTQIVSYYLTNSIESKYNNILLENMFNEEYDYNTKLRDIIECNTIIQQETAGSLKSEKYYNLNYINPYNNEKIHRSGLKYIIDNLINFHSNNTKLPILDLYIDKTFHWNEKVNKILNIIPYSSNWYGFIHHTCDKSFSTYNTIELFNKETFIRSLVYCKGIFVLSNYLRLKIIQILKKIKITNIPVYSICHPTEVDVEHFNLDKFIKNNDRGIIHIGTWLRNIYSYYNTIFPNKLVNNSFGKKNKISLSIKKSIIKGKNMDNYFPPTEIINTLKSNNIDKNSWYTHLYENLNNTINSVNILDFKTNEEYDEMLTNNIVFLNFVDISASNTLIECIVRNTPIIINKHPSVVELLGGKYPLYYDTNNLQYDIYNILTYVNIEKAHKYLKKIDKTKFTIGDFIIKLNKIFIQM